MQCQVPPGSAWQLGVLGDSIAGRDVPVVLRQSLSALANPVHTDKAGKICLQNGCPPPQPLPWFALSGEADAVTGCKEQSTVATKLGDQRCKEAFHLTSHHLLGFIRLHISVILHHLLQPCLATCHLCRIKGICVVLQDSQLEEGKSRKRVRAFSAFLGRWKAELPMSSSRSSQSSH